MKGSFIQTITKAGDQYFALSRRVQFALWFALIILIKFDTVLEPPVWDTAMGVFSPAIFLYETNFDVLELVKQPDWWEGGANVHSFSLWTWFIALVMSVTHSPTITFAVLHITTFAINALAISVFVRMLFQYKAVPWLALISGLFLMLTPLVLVQIGYIYTESLVMSLGVLAWASWHKAHEGRAVLFALLAVSMKLTGVVILMCISAVLLTRLWKGFSYKRLLLLVSMPLTLFVLISIDSWLGERPPTHDMGWGSKEVLFNSLKARFLKSFEIIWIVALGLLATVCYLYKLWCLNTGFKSAGLLKRRDHGNESQLLALVFTPLFLGGIIVMSSQASLFLYRYAVPMVPFAIVQFVLLAQLLKFEKVLCLVFLVGCVVSIYNFDGNLYRASGSFPEAERTHAYRAYYRAHETIIQRGIEKLGDEVPIYVSREIDYMASHPMMGYIAQAKPNVRGVYKTQYAEKALKDFPDQFYAVVTSRWHGGERLRSLISQAKRSDGWKIYKVYEQNTGGYDMFITHISRVGAN